MVLRHLPRNPGQAALVAAVIVAAAPAATLASSAPGRSDAGQLTASEPATVVVGVSDAAQRRLTAARAFGVSDAAQQTATAPTRRGATFGVSDAAQQTATAPTRRGATFGVSDAAQRAGSTAAGVQVLGVDEAARRDVMPRVVVSSGRTAALHRTAVIRSISPPAHAAVTAGDGFDWGSAAIGAAGGLVIAVAAAFGGAAALRPGRRSAGRPA